MIICVVCNPVVADSCMCCALVRIFDPYNVVTMVINGDYVLVQLLTDYPIIISWTVPRTLPSQCRNLAHGAPVSCIEGLRGRA